MKKIPKWLKWSIRVTGIAALLIIGVFFYFRYRLQHTSLETIEQRVDARRLQNQLQHQLAGSLQPSKPTNDKEDAASPLPAPLKKALAEAEDKTDKPIDPADAVDVAAILTRAGLTMKEMQYLMGKSESPLSADELRNVRKLLLAKLSPEETALLRKIVAPYGKKLDILDPAVPIDGEVDLALIEQFYGKGSGQDKAARAGKLPGQKGIPQEALPADNPSKDKETPTNKPDETDIRSSKERDQEGGANPDEASYLSSLQELQTACSRQVDAIVARIDQEIEKEKKDNQKVDVQRISKLFLPEITKSEQSCDTRFQAIVEQARQDHVTNDLIQSWKAAFEKNKSEKERQALARIVAAMK